MKLEDESVRKLLIIAFVANLILTAVSLAILPDQVAIHFGGGGLPDSWASKESNAAIFLVLEVPFFLLFYYASVMTLGVPRKFLNLPNKDYWLREENLVLFQRKFSYAMAEFGVAIFIFFFCINGLSLLANLSDPVQLNHAAVLAALVIYLSYVMWWLVKLVRSLQVPKGGV
jgi:uncharacterized membrane protein